MPEHLRALVVILVLTGPVLWLAQKPLCAMAMARQDYQRRCLLWLLVTLIAFLSHNFWIYVFVSGTLIAALSRRDRNPLAVYCLLLFAVPPFSDSIPGFGLVNYLFDLNHIRLLNLCILLPLAARLYEQRAERLPASSVPDYLLAGHLILIVGLVFVVAPLTGTVRQVFLLLLDVWLPYYVASRALKSREDFREVSAGFVLAAALLAVVALFEFARGWLLYSSLTSAIGVRWSFGSYLLRGEGGALRALASTGHSIVLGYVLMVGLAFLIYLGYAIRPRSSWWLAGLLLIAGLVASLARGPWVGAVAVLTVGLGIGNAAGKRIAWMVTCVALLGVALWASPWATKLIGYLPFVGTVDEGSVTYRQRLIEVSLYVLWQNPIFGAFDYLRNPAMEQMRQGEGIIDMVNTYLGVALTSGIVGLLLFVGPFAWAAVAIVRARRSVQAQEVEIEGLGRALLAALLGILITIATVSPINAVPTVYWVVVGLSVSYARRFGSSQSAKTSNPRGAAVPRRGAAVRPAP
jgi:O-antigen ligase